MVEPSSTAGVSEKMVSVCNSFTAPGDVEDRITRFKMLFDVILVCVEQIPCLCGDIESVLDAGWGCPCKEWRGGHSNQALGMSSDEDWLCMTCNLSGGCIQEDVEVGNDALIEISISIKHGITKRLVKHLTGGPIHQEVEDHGQELRDPIHQER